MRVLGLENDFILHHWLSDNWKLLGLLEGHHHKAQPVTAENSFFFEFLEKLQDLG